jgi:hypothetical protein
MYSSRIAHDQQISEFARTPSGNSEVMVVVRGREGMRRTAIVRQYRHPKCTSVSEFEYPDAIGILTGEDVLSWKLGKPSNPHWRR